MSAADRREPEGENILGNKMLENHENGVATRVIFAGESEGREGKTMGGGYVLPQLFFEGAFSAGTFSNQISR